MKKSMTIREIAELCEVDKTTVQRWAQKTDDAIRIEIDAKCRKALETKEEAGFSLPEALAIIRAGGKNTLASLLEDQIKEKPVQLKMPSGTQLHEFRMIYGKDAASRMDFLIGYSRTAYQPQQSLTDEERRIVDEAFPRLRLLAEHGPSQPELALGGNA